MSRELHTQLLFILGAAIILLSISNTKRSNMPLFILRGRLNQDIENMQSYYDFACSSYGGNSSQALSTQYQIMELQFSRGLVTAEIWGNWFVDGVCKIIGLGVVVVAIWGDRDELSSD